MNKESLILRLYEIGAIKFGNFTLKSGMQSPIYIDLRRIVSYPDTMRVVAELLWQQIKHCSFDLICGVPYTALPLATAMSLMHNKPMVIRRKEVKEYGTKQTIEGVFCAGQTCLVVEDLFTTGSSALETTAPLEQAGLKVEHMVILINRQQGGIANVEKRGYFVHPVLTMSGIMNCLQEKQIISQEIVCEVETYLRQHQKTI
jgi:uridine monophosphate synthetase